MRFTCPSLADVRRRHLIRTRCCKRRVCSSLNGHRASTWRSMHRSRGVQIATGFFCSACWAVADCERRIHTSDHRSSARRPLTKNPILALVACTAFIFAVSTNVSHASFTRDDLTGCSHPAVLAKTGGIRLVQRIRIRPKFRSPYKRQATPQYRPSVRRPGTAQPKEEKSGGSPGRVDNCDTKRGGEVECSSQATRLWDMLMSWF